MDERDFGAAAQALAKLDHLGVPELEILYKLERTSGQLYFHLADNIGNEEAAELLRRNGREELGHANRMGQAIGIKLGRAYEASAGMKAGYPVAAPTAVDAALLSAIARGERAGDADYQRWAASEADEKVARLLRISGTEESAHADRVARAITLLDSAG
ncbi:Rubrerythrin domain-containing protein [Frankia sp. Hr75.2]|nr:Rubrerythrin domain-containing protein [Frankia sp. Hr75.2]